MEVTDSDHKPVRCKFNVKISHADRSIRRKELGRIMNSNEKIKSMINELRCVPETSVSTNKVVLQNHETSIVQLSNKSKEDKAVFTIICEGISAVQGDEKSSEYRPVGNFSFPRWLEVLPLL